MKPQISTSEETGSIYERLRTLRKTLGLSQEEFGGRIGKALRTIQYWEAGTVQIPDTALKHISQVFGVSYEWLKEGKGEMRKKKGTVGERIRLVRKALGLTQKGFADRIGITYQMLGLYERGVYEPSEKVLKLISSVFGVSSEWLKSGKGHMWERQKAIAEQVSERWVRIPVVGRVGEEFPENSADIDVVDWVLVSKETFQKGGELSVYVHDDSMEPALRSGDVVVFKPYVGDGDDIPDGKVVVIQNQNGELIVRRLMRISGEVVLASDNPKHPPIQKEGIRIVGLGVRILKEVEV
jgi:transcriptional regulator with XRE-family HTH domain